MISKDIYIEDAHKKTCRRCDSIFYATHPNRKICDVCRTKKFCKECDVDITNVHQHTYSGHHYCTTCFVKNSHKKNNEHNKDEWIECRVCGFRAKEITTHIINVHKIAPKDYGITKCQTSINRVKGENNPAFGHGGRLSPFSKNFIKYTSEEAYQNGFKSVLEKQAKTISENPQNWDTKIEFYLEQGMTQEDAEKALSERQATFTLKKCIQRHGVEEGKKIWQERQDKWQSTLNSKSQEEIDLINRKKSVLSLDSYIARGFTEEEALPMLEAARAKMKVGHSKEALAFMKSFIPEEIMDKAYHSDNEWFIYDKEQSRYFLYDFMFNNVIFEYHGEAYHPNLEVISEEQLANWKTPYGLTAEYVLKNDARKKVLVERAGFKFFYVYSNDSDERKEQVKKEILEAIYEK